jgi:hypothetical protein
MSDTVVRHRPFWSVFILGTEKWLGDMSSSGLHLCGLNFHGKFQFNVGKPQKHKYCFVYTKFEGTKGGAKSSRYGWEKIAHHDKWSIYRSTGEVQKAMPNRRGLYLRNNSLLCLYALLSSIVLLAALGTVFGIFALISRDTASNDDFFRKAIVIIGVFAILILCNFVLFLSMTSANNRILEEPCDVIAPVNAYKQFLNHKTFETWLEKLLIKDGDIIKRFRSLWLMTPRGLETWLSRMEQRGFNVYKVHKSGALFYFTKGTPRNVRYCVINSEGGNIARCIEGGWQVVYSTAGLFGKFGHIAVLSRAYEDEPPLPFKSEKEYVSNAARIMAKFILFYAVFLILLIVVFFALVYFSASQAGIWVAGAAVGICTLLIVRLLLYFANTVKIARKGRFKQILH